MKFARETSRTSKSKLGVRSGFRTQDIIFRATRPGMWKFLDPKAKPAVQALYQQKHSIGLHWTIEQVKKVSGMLLVAFQLGLQQLV